DGATLGGMVASEEVLPHFVRERSLGGWNRVYFTQKAETPVTYFYTDRPRTVQVRVDMPEGLLTHWSPPVTSFGPPATTRQLPDGNLITEYSKTPLPGGSFLDWGQFDLIPDTRLQPPQPGTATPAPRPVGRDDTWRYARETDAALVRFGPNHPFLPNRTEY